MPAGDPIIEAYLEAGDSYGITCRGDTAVLDADEPDALASVIDALPETAWQVSRSRESKHYFLHIPGLNEDIPLDDPEIGENIGHIKAAEQSLVIGPGSRHPSGNRYGPLHGDTIATIPEAEFRDLIAPYRPDSTNQSEDHRQDILTGARQGMSLQGCARLASVDESTLHRWIDKYEDFCKSLKRARAQGELKHLQSVNDPGSRFLLERSFGYVKTEKREISGEGGAPINISISETMVETPHTQGDDIYPDGDDP